MTLAMTVHALAERSVPPDSRFAALRTRNYRIYMAGQSFAMAGTWMQSVAQDWLILSLTHSPVAVAFTMTLQFLPMLLLGAYGGLIADRYPRRRLLLITQTANAGLAGLLAVLTLAAVVRPADVFALAFLGGIVFAVDGPARQVLVAEVVPPERLQGAISINAAVFHTTRLAGPALAGELIGTVGTGWVFAITSLCFLGPSVGLLRLRPDQLRSGSPAVREPRALRSAAWYVLQRPRLLWTIVLVGTVGTFGLNFPIVLTVMAQTTFHGDASTYGLFSTALAAGSVSGALLGGTRRIGGLRQIAAAAAAFGIAQCANALAPTLPIMLALLVLLGAANLAFQAIANSSVQLWVDPAYRGRVMGLYLLVFVGGTPIGAPIIGAVTAEFGPRVAMIICGLVPAVVAGGLLLRLRAGSSRAAPPAQACSAPGC